MAEKDYYSTLGVAKSATKEEIKKAFKKLALTYHPDRAPEDKKKEYEEKFKEINEAVSILGDDKKRQQYDQYGSASFSQGAGFEGFDFSDVMSQFRSGTFGDFDDIFDHIFGEGRSSRGRRGSDLLYEAEVSLEEVMKGTTKDISLHKLEYCDDCKGKGAMSFESCHHCQGSGYMRRTQRTPFGLFQQSGPCPYCHGRGELPQDSCGSCSGEGVLRRKKKIEVKIPAGIQEGIRLRVAGEGEIGQLGASSGDLYVQVRIAQHPYFFRKESDLHIEVPISFTQAVLGDEIEVPTMSGKAKLKIPAGTQPGTQLRMHGKGIPHLRGDESGDQIVTVNIEIPTKISSKQKELIKQLGEEKPSKGFLKKFLGM